MKKVMSLCITSITLLIASTAISYANETGDRKRAVTALRYGEPAPAYHIYDKGVALAVKGDFKKAKIIFSKITRENRLYQSAVSSSMVAQDAIDDRRLKNVVIQYFKADIKLHNRQREEGIAELSKCIKLNPRYVKPYIRRGSTYDLLGKKDLALSDYSKVIKLDPKNSDAYHRRGLLYKADKKYKLALRDYSKSIKVSNDKSAYVSRSELHAIMGKFSNAASDAKKAIKADPYNPVAYNILGYVSIQQNNKTQACASYIKACELGVCSGIETNRANGYCR